MQKYLKYMLFGFIIFSSLMINVNAETKSCNYDYTDSNGVKFYANCNIEINGNKVKTSCLMNYFFKGNEKTKKVSILNDSVTVQEFVYSTSGISFNDKIVETKKCPDYVLGYYESKTFFGTDNTKLQLYAAEDKAAKDNLAATFSSSQVYYVDDDLAINTKKYKVAMKNKEVETSEDDKTAIYESIAIEEAKIRNLIDDYKANSCMKEDVLITKYSECKKKINSIETIKNSVKSSLTKYIENNDIDSNDSRVIKLNKTIAEAEKLIKEQNEIIEDTDCEVKKQLGLVKYCGVSTNKNENTDYINACSDIPETMALIKQIYNIIKFLIPIIIIGLSIVDFLKVLINGEEKVYKEAWSKLVKRLIIGIVILILPTILSFIINLSGALGTYDIDKNNIFCIFT